MTVEKTTMPLCASLLSEGLESITISYDEGNALQQAAELGEGSYTRAICNDSIELLGVESNRWAFVIIERMRSNK